MSTPTPEPGSEHRGASVPPPGAGSPEAAPSPLDHPRPARPETPAPPAQSGPQPDQLTPDESGPHPDGFTPAQAEAVARVAAMAAARPAAAQGGLSRAATVALVGLGVLVFAMVLLALIVA